MAGSFLPTYGPLPPGTQVVPSEILDPATDRVKDTATAVVLEISLKVVLTRQQVMDDDLSSALLQFRRRGTQVGQLEDWYIFNGQYPHGGPMPISGDTWKGVKAPFYCPAVEYWESISVTGIQEPMAGVGSLRQKSILLQRNPGALGLFEGIAEIGSAGDDTKSLSIARVQTQSLDDHGLAMAVVDAITKLDERGYVAPYVCVFGRGPFMAANKPLESGAVPRSQIEPLIGRSILHAGAIDLLPRGLPAADWPNRGLLLSLAGDPVDIAIVAEATPEFRQIDGNGHYVFAVFERFALRIKDPTAIVTLAFK